MQHREDAETAKDATVIEISGQIALDATVTVEPADKKVCIRATAAVNDHKNRLILRMTCLKYPERS